MKQSKWIKSNWNNIEKSELIYKCWSHVSYSWGFSFFLSLCAGLSPLFINYINNYLIWQPPISPTQFNFFFQKDLDFFTWSSLEQYRHLLNSKHDWKQLFYQSTINHKCKNYLWAIIFLCLILYYLKLTL